MVQSKRWTSCHVLDTSYWHTTLVEKDEVVCFGYVYNSGRRNNTRCARGGRKWVSYYLLHIDGGAAANKKNRRCSRVGKNGIPPLGIPYV